MDTSKIDPDYDCGDTDNKFENLPKNEQEWWKKRCAEADALEAKNKETKKESAK
jgi:hypothetical protein